MKQLSRTRSITYAVTITALLATSVMTWVEFATAASERQQVIAATVQITTIANSPDFAKPWQAKGTETTTGSGVIIHGNRILTNAHVVVWAASIEVKRPGHQKSYLAHVQHIDHGCDLALLTVEEPEFFRDVSPLEVGELPVIEAAVNAYGYPVGGETVSATSGVISRLEHDVYTHSYRSLLVAQIDAALNPGNSGGPVVSDGKIVGIAMQTLEEGENIGYVIPAPVVSRFLVDANDGEITGVPGLGAYYLPIESEAQREYLGLGNDRTGAIIVEVSFGSSSWGKIHAGDVITAIDGVRVANDGTVPIADGLRLDFTYLIESKQVGDVADLTIWRDRTELKVTLHLDTYELLVGSPSYAARCTYRIMGGIVFQPVEINLLLSMGEDLPVNLYYPAIVEKPRTPERREMVVMTDVLPHRVNRGYQDWEWDIVETVQGVPVRDFAHFNELLDDASGRWLKLGLDDKSQLVLDLAAARTANIEVLDKFLIPQDRWPVAERGEMAMR